MRSIGLGEPYSYVVINQKSDLVASDLNGIACTTKKQLRPLTATIPNFPRPTGLGPGFGRPPLYKIVSPVSP